MQATENDSTTQANESHSKRMKGFVVVFAIIALCINSVKWGEEARERQIQRQRIQAQQQTQAVFQQQAETQNAIQEAHAKHEQYVAQYVNSGFTKTAGIKSLAIIAVNQNGSSEPALSAAIANHLKSPAVKISTTFFKPKFVSDRLFANVFDGATDILNKLDLSNSLDGVLLARETVQFVQNPASLDSILTANTTLEIQLVPVGSGIQNTTWKYTAAGAGFSQMEAKSNAEERLIKKISDDATMSLSN